MPQIADISRYLDRIERASPVQVRGRVKEVVGLVVKAVVPEAWIGEMLRYDPAKHTGDRLMASWIAKEAARVGSRSGPRAEYGSIDLLSR